MNELERKINKKGRRAFVDEPHQTGLNLEKQTDESVCRQFLQALNWQIVIETAILIVILICLVYSLVTGNYRNYIHPRYQPFLWISAGIVLAGIIAQSGRIKDVHYQFGLYKFSWLLIPIMALVFLIEIPLAGDDINLEKVDEIVQVETDKNLGSGVPPISGNANSGDVAEKLPSVKGSILIDSAHYPSWLVAVMTEPEKYVGKTYTYLGRISKDSTLPSDLFLPGRPIMFCCAADARSMGLLANSKEEYLAKLGQWVYITGKVVLRKGGDPTNPDIEAPMLEIIELTDAPQPRSEFAYYYGTVSVPDEPEV